MDRLTLYSRYAFRSFLRGRSRTIFGAFCVAAGVAGVVSLQLVGTNFRHAITDSSQKTNRGDIAVDATGPDLTRQQIGVFARLQQQGRISRYTLVIDRSATIRSVGGSLYSIAAVTGVDPSVYPFYDRIVAEKPAGMPLREALRRSDDVGVSADIFDHLRLRLGDRIILSGRIASHVVRVRAVLPENAQSLGGGFLGASDFVFVTYALIAPRPGDRGHAATHVYVQTRSAAAATAAKPLIERGIGPLFDVNTAADVLAQASDVSNKLSSFLTIMGLVALLIGGIGVVNTMLVSVRRRVREIAVLKALGMKGGEVTLVFLVEAALLGLSGSIIGLGLGIAASVVVNGIAADLIGIDLTWHLYALPLVVGVLVGILASALFALLPALRASDTRPLAVLQDAAATLPPEPRPRAIAATLAAAGVMGVAASYMVGLQTPLHPVVLGLLMGYGVLIAIVLCLAICLGIVWMVSRLPSFNVLTLRLALRNVGRQRRRMAATLLALFIGVLAVGSVAIIAGNVKGAIATAFGTQLRANVLLFTTTTPRNERAVMKEVRRLPGLRSIEQSFVAGDAQLSAINGVPLDSVLQRHLKTGRGTGSLLSGLFGRDLRLARFTDKLSAGRVLGGADRGTHNAVILGRLAAALGIRLGDRLEYATGAGPVDVRVVGIIKAKSVTFTFGTTIDNELARRIAEQESNPLGDFQATYLQIDETRRAGDVALLRRRLPRAFILDLSALIPLFNRLIDKMALFPEIIAALSLFAGAIIMANSVALAVLERQREIAVMKAVGAKGRTVLRLLLVENALVGLIGGILGVAAATVTVVILDHTVLNIVPSFDPLTILGLIAMAALLGAVASLISAWPASRQNPTVVLRYE